jgi:SMODS-associated and fused to various effectors sensor domain
MTIDQLRHRKAQHENEIAHLTGLASDRRSSILRVFGHIKGAPAVLDRAEAARAVIRSGERFPLFMPAFDRQGIEVDLRRLPGEGTATPAYYAAATQMINDALDRVRQGVERGDVVHLSVFAFARLPLLVYLGAHLDDAVAAEIYQRHRASNGWEWPQAGHAQVFTASMLNAGAAEASDGALVVNLSGNARVDDLPESLVDAPVWELSPERRDEDVIGSRESLAAFESAVRHFFTHLESTHKHLTRLHVFGPIPVSAAVTLGRVLKAPDLRPSVVTYDWTTNAYKLAVEV